MATTAPADASPLTDLQFKDVHQKLCNRRREKLKNKDFNGSWEFERTMDNYLESLLPDPKHREAYIKWTGKEFMKKRETRQAREANPAEDYQVLLRHTRLTDKKHVQRLTTLYNRPRHPYISIGSHCGYKYRLEPTIGLLEPPEENIWYDDPHEVAPDYIVGINIVDVDGWRLTNDTNSMTARQRSAKRKQRSSEESYHSGSGSSSDKDIFDMETEYAFAFMQLGRVLNIRASDFHSKKAQDKNESDMEWEYSGYILGVTTNGPDGKLPGTPGEVWLVYDFDPIDEASNTVAHLRDLGPQDPGWGYLFGQKEGEGDHERRGGFKIADSFDELGPDFQWNIQKYFNSFYEITQTMLFKDRVHGSFIVNQPLGAESAAWLAKQEAERQLAALHQEHIRLVESSSDDYGDEDCMED